MDIFAKTCAAPSVRKFVSRCAASSFWVVNTRAKRSVTQENLAPINVKQKIKFSVSANLEQLNFPATPNFCYKWHATMSALSSSVNSSQKDPAGAQNLSAGVPAAVLPCGSE